MRELTVSLLQFDVRKGNPRANWSRVQELVAQAAQRGAQLVVLPELWEAGAAYEQSQEIASSLNGGLFAQMVALSRQHRLVIIGSLFEKRGQHVYNTIAVPSPRGGIMGAYRKMHLFPLMQEDRWLHAGESPLTLDMPWGRTGFAICYDLRG
jgi:predicted amidohydrolase